MYSLPRFFADTLRRWLALLFLVGVFTSIESFAQNSKKITLQGVIRRSGVSGTDALINNVPLTANAVVTLQCEGDCSGSSPRSYGVGTGLLAADSIVPVRNGAFAVSIVPSAATLADMAKFRADFWSIRIEGTLDPHSASAVFVIRLEGVPFANIADTSLTSINAQHLQGVSVDLSAIATDGKVLQSSGGKLSLVSLPVAAAGGPNYSAGLGILLSGVSNDVIGIDSQVVATLSGGKISASMLPVVPTSSLPLGGVTGLVQLAGGTIPSALLSNLPGTAFAPSSINASVHIANGTITSSKYAPGSVDATALASGAVENSLGFFPLDRAGDSVSGSLDVGGNLGANLFEVRGHGALRLDDTGSHFIAFKAPDSLSTNLSWTLPSSDGTSGQMLVTTGGGTLGWATPNTGSGNLIGPGTSFDGAIPRWSGTTGTALSNSGVMIDSANNLVGALDIQASGTIHAGVFNSAGFASNRLVLTDGSNSLVSSSVAIGDAQLSQLSGVTANVQSQIDSVRASVATKQNELGFTPLNKSGDTMNGLLMVPTILSPGMVSAAGVIVNNLAANRLVVSDGFSRLNSLATPIGDTELRFLEGLTGNVQSQITTLALVGGGGSGNVVQKTGDTMSGGLRVGGNLTATGQVASNNLETTTFLCGTDTIDWNNGNIQVLSDGTNLSGVNCTVNMANLKDGGSYTLIIRGDAAQFSNYLTFAHPGVTGWYFVPANTWTNGGGQRTVYTFIKFGADVYVAWIDGFQ